MFPPGTFPVAGYVDPARCALPRGSPTSMRWNLTGTYALDTSGYTDPGRRARSKRRFVPVRRTTEIGAYGGVMPDPSAVQAGVSFGEDELGTYDPVTNKFTDPGSAWVAVGRTYVFAGAAQIAYYTTDQMSVSKFSSQTIGTSGTLTVSQTSIPLNLSIGGVNIASGTITENAAGNIGQNFSPPSAGAGRRDVDHADRQRRRRRDDHRCPGRHREHKQGRPLLVRRDARCR